MAHYIIVLACALHGLWHVNVLRQIVHVLSLLADHRTLASPLMSDPSRMVVDTAGPGDFVDSGDDHFDTDHFIEQLFPVRRENHEPEFEEEVKPEKEESIIENPDRCLNVSCPPVHNCAKYKLEEGECCARCVNLVNKWRTCSQCQPVPGCLKYKIPKRPGAGCCATCVKRKNRVAGRSMCPHRITKLQFQSESRKT